MTPSLTLSKGWLAAAFAVVTLGSAVLASLGGGGESEPNQPPPPASTPMAATMMRVGLDAERLAAAGATSQEVTAAVAAAMAEHGSTTLSLQQADKDFAACKPVCSELERKIQSGLGKADDVTAYQAATADLAKRIAARDGVLEDIFEAGIAGLSSTQQATLKTIRANAHWRLPVAYLAEDRSEADWVKLRDYLDARRIYLADGEEVPGEVTGFLAQVEGSSAVSKAKAGIDSNLAAVQTAWNAGVTH